MGIRDLFYFIKKKDDQKDKYEKNNYDEKLSHKNNKKRHATKETSKQQKATEQEIDRELSVIKKAFKLLFPSKNIKRKLNVVFSNKLKDYDCRVYYNSFYVSFHISKEWKHINENIKLGLYQSMWLKILRKKLSDCENKSKTYLDLYHNFIKSIGEFRSKKYIDEELLRYFNELNNTYFHGMLAVPNLRWRKLVKYRFGYYNYSQDTITINRLIRPYPELVKYVLYHEMLHKKYKYSVAKDGTTRHHTKKFKLKERTYPNADLYEKMLDYFAKHGKLSNRLMSKIKDCQKQSGTNIS